MADLRQVLSQGRKRIGLLIGAGAPMSLLVDGHGGLDPKGKPLVPGVDALTAQVLGDLHGQQGAAASNLATELGGTPNIEAVLSRIRLLETALGNTPVHGLDGKGYGDLAKAVCEGIGRVVSVKLPSGRSPYSELVAWSSGTLRAHPVEIFTTNYDLLFEEAFERSHVPYFDGFAGANLPFFDPVTVSSDDLPARWARLWKLHGSLGWALEGSTVVRKGGRDASQLVYPDHLKYDLTQKQPYASLFERLKNFLLTPDTLLLTAGFSFRDAHISGVIDDALSMNANAAVIAFQFETLAAEASVCTLALNRPNLSVYASDGAVIGGVPGDWRPGELPKNWREIRTTFWGNRGDQAGQHFLLGDFAKLTRFFALAQSTDMALEKLGDAMAESADQVGSGPNTVSSESLVAATG